MGFVIDAIHAMRQQMRVVHLLPTDDATREELDRRSAEHLAGALVVLHIIRRLQHLSKRHREAPLTLHYLVSLVDVESSFTILEIGNGLSKHSMLSLPVATATRDIDDLVLWQSGLPRRRLFQAGIALRVDGPNCSALRTSSTGYGTRIRTTLSTPDLFANHHSR